jgi:hypothetical protein
MLVARSMAAVLETSWPEMVAALRAIDGSGEMGGP